MSVSNIMNNGLSALLANQTALRTTSNNVANVNTEGYVRLETEMVAKSIGGQGNGVEAVVTRAANRYLAETHLRGISEASHYSASADLLDRAQASLGDPSGTTSVFSSIDTLMSKSSTLLNDPTSSLRQSDLVSAMQSTFSDLQSGFETVTRLRTEADTKIKSSLSSANLMMENIADMNQEIRRLKVMGADTSGLETEQGKLVDDLAGLMDFKINYPGAGGVELRTSTGVLLADNEAATLSISTDTDASGYGGVVLTAPNSANNTSLDITEQITGGEIRGLLNARDHDLPEVAYDLSELSSTIARALNEAANEGTASPAPTSLTGRDTGLLAGDSLGFTGAAVFAVVDSDGRTVDRVSVDFDAGTLTNAAGTVSATGATIGSFVSALDASFGGNASVSFADGTLSLSATGTNGVAIAQDPTTPSDRGGMGVSAFFGMNDVVTSTRPYTYDTGLSASDAHGFTSGTITFGVRDENGSIIHEVEYTPAGTSMTDLINGMNTSAVLGNYGTASLDANGRLTLTPNVGMGASVVDVVSDSTTRGPTGPAMSDMFGLGLSSPSNRAVSLGVKEALTLNPSLLPSSGYDTSAMAVGDLSVASGDNKGALAIQTALNSKMSVFDATGTPGGSMTITDFTADVASSAGSRASFLETRAAAAEAMRTEAEERRASAEGVNLDEEMVKMTIYQQSYSAASRLITTARDMYDTLLNMV